MNFDNFINLYLQSRFRRTAVSRKNTFSVKWADADAGKKIFPMDLADMEFLTARQITAVIKNRASHGVYGYTYYPDTMLDPFVSWLAKRHDWHVRKKSISVCHGVISSLNLAVRAFSKYGDGVIIQPPVYRPFYNIISSNNRVVLENTLLRKNNRYEMDFDGLEVIAKKAKLLILCNPHNPVGRVWSRQELKTLGNICLKNNVIIISDDIHCDFTYGTRYIPIASISQNFSENCITCQSPSKTFNLAGLNASTTVINNPVMLEKFEKEKKCSGFGRINIFAARAIEAAYKYGDGWLDELITFLKGNIETAIKIFSSSKNIDVTYPEGTYLMWLDFRRTGLSQREIQERLNKKAGIILEPGGVFGISGDGFHRMNIACGKQELIRNVKKMAGEFNAVKKKVR